MRVALLFVFCCFPALCQEATSGFALPITLSGDAFYSHRRQEIDDDQSPAAAAFRLMLMPSIKINSHWFAYAALQVRETPYFYYDAYAYGRRLDFSPIQALVGYTTPIGGGNLIVKAGQLLSAFGSFPLRYDDTDNPLLDQPLNYITPIKLRPDQLPCGVDDVLHQINYFGEVEHYCGGATSERDGMTPVTLYGLPGIQADVSYRRIDLRLQITNSSPANPQNLLSNSQHAQWTAGGGYTIIQGFRIGTSVFRGPYMEQPMAGLVGPGKTVRDFPATGSGIDVQWARGRWIAIGEWQRIVFDSPRFTVSPAVNFGYVEVKRGLTPRLFVAGRAGWQQFGRFADKAGRSASAFAPAQQSYEFAAGCWVTRRQLLKIGYEWLRRDGLIGTRENVLGIQFVTSINSISRAFR